ATETATSNIGRIPTSIAPGTTGTAFTVPSGGAPLAIVAGANGNLYFTESSTGPSNGGTIAEMTTAGTIVTETMVDTTHTIGLAGLAQAPNGKLWFTEQSPGIVGNMDPTTHAITPFQITGTSHPSAITVAPDGNVWFVDQGNNEIGNISPTNVFTSYTVPTGSAFGINAEPFGIAIGPDGNVWFTEQSAGGGGKIGKLTVPSVASLAIAPNPLTFGSQALGTTSTAMTATLTASGGTVTFSSVTLGGTNAADFTMTNNCTTTSTTCTVSV